MLECQSAPLLLSERGSPRNKQQEQKRKELAQGGTHDSPLNRYVSGVSE
jgi:hypothetical protein